MTDQDLKNKSNHTSKISLKKQKIKWSKIIFYILTAICLVVIYAKFSELQLLKNFFINSSGLFLWAIVGSQFFNYFFQGFNYKAVLKLKDLNVSARDMIPLTFVTQFVTQLVPTGGLSGQMFLVYYLKRHKMTLSEGMARAALEVMTLYVAYIVLFIPAFIMILNYGIQKTSPIMWGFLAMFIVFGAFAIFLYLAVQKHWKINLISKIVNRLHLSFESGLISKIKNTNLISGHSHHVTEILNQISSVFDIKFIRSKWKTFFMACFWQAGLLISNVMTLFLIAVAIGKPISFGIAFVTFMMAKLISITSFIPGALGIYEGGMSIVLVAFGIPVGTAIAITLIFRVFTFWLPMPIGWAFYRIYMKEIENIESQKEEKIEI